MQTGKQMSDGWLSYQTLAKDMTDKELLDLQLRLAQQLWAVDLEIDNRRYSKFKRDKPRVTLTEADLQDPKRTRGTRARREQKGKKEAAKGLSVMQSVLDSLTPEQRAKVQEALARKLNVPRP